MLHKAEAPYSNKHLNVIAIILKKKRQLPTKNDERLISHILYILD